jgi:hypothetical protein
MLKAWNGSSVNSGSPLLFYSIPRWLTMVGSEVLWRP